MNTAVWTFLVIVVLFSVGGYFGLKRYSVYYANKKTKRILEEFKKENDIDTEEKSFDEVEKELHSASAEESSKRE